MRHSSFKLAPTGDAGRRGLASAAWSQRLASLLYGAASLLLLVQFALASVAAHRYAHEPDARHAAAIVSVAVGVPVSFCVHHAPDHAGLRSRCDHRAAYKLAGADSTVPGFAEAKAGPQALMRLQFSRDGPSDSLAYRGASCPRGPPA